MKKIILLVLAFHALLTLNAQDNNEAIHVDVQGKGQPILLLSGFNVPGEMWQPFVNQLKDNYECHIVTLAGFGGKAAIDFPWLPQINKALVDYIDSKNLKDVTVIGHSLGGTIAAWLASREDNNISEIILIDALPAAGALMIPNFNPDDLKYDNPFSNQQLAMDDAQFEQMITAMAKGMSVNESAQETIKDWMLQADRKTYVYGYTDYLKLDVREDLKAITIPVTIMAAAKPYGAETVTKTYKDQYQNLKAYDFIIAENSAHFIMLDEPDWFIKQLKQILE